MHPPPAVFSDFPLVCYTPIDWRHQPTGACTHTVGGEVLGPVAGLAVCTDAGSGYYLFYCDAAWKPITDTWHPTLDEALDQAEFEYAGTATTWERAS